MFTSTTDDMQLLLHGQSFECTSLFTMSNSSQNSLNIDVFHITTSLLDKRDCIRLSLVNKDLRAIAIKKILLSFETIHLRRNAGLKSFCACVLADAKGRGGLITSLQIGRQIFLPTIFRSDIANLTQVLQHCLHLNSLTIPFLGELLKADSSFGNSPC